MFQRHLEHVNGAGQGADEPMSQRTDEDLVAAGETVDTSPIDVDAARLIGQGLDSYR